QAHHRRAEDPALHEHEGQDADDGVALTSEEIERAMPETLVDDVAPATPMCGGRERMPAHIGIPSAPVGERSALDADRFSRAHAVTALSRKSRAVRNSAPQSRSIATSWPSRGSTRRRLW